jgi:hypothetical protein
MRTLAAAILASTMLAAPNAVRAQERFAAETAHAFSSAPFSPFANDGSGVLVEAGQANDRAEVSLQWVNGLGLKLGAPTDKTSGEGTFTNLDGLAGNLTLAVAWSKLLNPKVANSELDAQRNAICEGPGLGLTVADCRSDTELEMALEKLGRSAREIESAFAEYRKTWLPSSYLWSIAVEGKAGYKNFEFFDTAGAKDDADLYSGSLSAALVGTHGSGRLLFGVTYEDAKKAQKKVVQKCDPVQGSTALEECKSLPLGRPSAEQATILRAEYRRFLGKIAIAPLASYNIKEEILALELPIYFLHDSKDLLTGGVRLGWRDDDGDLAASIFVGKPLGLF